MSAPPECGEQFRRFVLYAYYRFQEIYLSAIWAGIILWRQPSSTGGHRGRAICLGCMPFAESSGKSCLGSSPLRSRCSISLCPTRLGDWAAIEAGGLVAGARSAIARERLCDRLGMGELRRRCGDAKPGAAVWQDPTSACWSTIAADALFHNRSSRLLVVTHTPKATAAGVLRGGEAKPSRL